jgi:hypothetical protein
VVQPNWPQLVPAGHARPHPRQSVAVVVTFVLHTPSQQVPVWPAAFVHVVPTCALVQFAGVTHERLRHWVVPVQATPQAPQFGDESRPTQAPEQHRPSRPPPRLQVAFSLRASHWVMAQAFRPLCSTQSVPGPQLPASAPHEGTHKPEAHSAAPAAAAGQLNPQPPHALTSLCGDLHEPSQQNPTPPSRKLQVSPGLQGCVTHWPAMQAWPKPQRRPHWPQLDQSVCVSTQTFAQRSCCPGHEGTPPPPVAPPATPPAVTKPPAVAMPPAWAAPPADALPPALAVPPPALPPPRTRQTPAAQTSAPRHSAHETPSSPQCATELPTHSPVEVQQPKQEPGPHGC